jgi:16S rRNA (cytosine967-C5)-methyltransferase
MRKIVFDILIEHKREKTFLNLKLKNLSQDLDIKNITIRVYGIVQNYQYLEYKIEEVTKDKKLDEKAKLILMMALYEKLYLDSVPDYAIISEFTNLSHLVNNKSVKYISYFLNNLLVLASEAEPKFANEVKNISIIYSHPQWVVKKLIKQYPMDYMNIIKANQKQKKITARIVNPLIEPELFSEIGFSDLVTSEVNILKTTDFIENNLIIQDLGSYLVSKMVNADDRHLVLDLCAAPGNKTMHIAQSAKHVYANEINLRRFELMQRNVEKYNYKNITTLNYDATDFEALTAEFGSLKFDRILIDAPCSGWGVFRSKPDIKANQNQASILDIIKVQQKILENAVRFLAIDGELVYSTCTINKEENEQQMEKLLAANEFEEIKDETIESLSTKNKFGYTLTPDQHDCDGFYMCKIKRI